MQSKYSQLKFFVRIALQVEVWEYHYLEMIKSLQGNPASEKPGWAYISNASAGFLLGRSYRQIQRLKLDLEKRDLILRDKKSGHIRVTPKAWDALHIEEVTPQMIEQMKTQIPENEIEYILSALYTPKGRHNVAPGTTPGRTPHDIMSPNSNTNSNSNNGGGVEPKISDFQDLKNLILSRQFHEESTAARMEIQRIVEKFYQEKWFKSQFEYCWPPERTNAPIGVIVNGWIKTGYWTNVATFKIQNINGWITTTGAKFNRPTGAPEPKPQTNGRRKNGFTDDLA